MEHFISVKVLYSPPVLLVRHFNTLGDDLSGTDNALPRHAVIGQTCGGEKESVG